MTISKAFLISTLPLFLTVASAPPCTEFGLSLFEGAIALEIADESQKEAETIKSLSPEEITVLSQLGPIYKKIYLYAFTEDMRRRVVLYVCRGLTTFEAINVVLRAEQRKYEGNGGKKSLSPCERSMLKPSKPKADVTG